MSPFRTVALIFLALGLADARAETLDPDRLLEDAKAASGGAAWDRILAWHEEGRLTYGGLAGTYATWTDFRAFRDVSTFTVGPVSGNQGWDGKRSWTTDSSGEVRVEMSAEAVAAAVQETYLDSRAYWFPGRYPAERAYAGVRSADGLVFDAVRITPKDAEPVELWIDRASHRILRAVQLGGVRPHTFRYEDFHTVSGVVVPFRTVDLIGDPAYDAVSVVTAAEVNPRLEDRRFDPPPPPGTDVHFPAGRDRVKVSIDIRNNHIYLPVSIDGRPPVPFLFDTGSTNFIDARYAAEAGLKVEGSLPSVGFGDGIEPAGAAKVESVAVEGLSLSRQIFFSMDDATVLAAEQPPPKGLIGYEFAKRAVTVIDYADRTITFVRPDAFRPDPDSVAVPFTFDQHIPVIQAVIDGMPGEFEVDTGSRASLTLMHPFVERHGLVERYHATVSAVTTYGVGGASRSMLARAGGLTIGPFEVRAPITDLMMDATGAAASPRTAGNIGGGILRRFTVTLDYPEHRIYLAPNVRFSEREVFDRSGIWIDRDSRGSIAISQVASPSPASAAGLERGDRIISVDGEPAAKVGLTALRDRLRAKPGTLVTLGIEGKGIVSLTLAELV